MLKFLPHHYKKKGFIMAPLGFFLWFSVQKRWIIDISQFLEISNHKILNVPIAVIGFFSFLIGAYFMVFSKEKIEDEMIKSIRLECFQMAAKVQMIFTIIGLTLMSFVTGKYADNLLSLLFLSIIIVFWITYLIRFNYLVNVKKM